MRRFAPTFVLIIFLVLQAFFVRKMAIGRIAPDVPLLIVVYFAMFRGAFHGSLLGFLVGLLQDLFNATHLGLNAFTKTLTGYFIGLAGSKAEPDSSLFFFALVGIAGLAHDFVYLLIFTGMHLGKFFVMWVTVSIPSAIYTAVVGLVVHLLVSYAATEVVRSIGKTRS